MRMNFYLKIRDLPCCNYMNNVFTQRIESSNEALVKWHMYLIYVVAESGIYVRGVRLKDKIENKKLI